MIASILPQSHKAKMSEKIAREMDAFLSAGGQVDTVPFGACRDGLESYRDLQAKLAKINAVAKGVRESSCD